MKHKTKNILLVLVFVSILALGFRIITDHELFTKKFFSEADLQTIETEKDVPKFRGILEVKEGEMLERDIIPQLCQVFDLTEQDVKDLLERPITSNLIHEKLTDFRRLEGVIPPGTYDVPVGESLDHWIERIVIEAEKRYTTLLAQADGINTLKPYEQLIIASIVEAECLAKKQYTETAAVFLNRFADQSALQSCVTAEYALGFQRAFLYEEDIIVQDPYNTYVVNGLPLGPICSVGDQSLLAAIQPSQYPLLYYFFYDYLQNEMFFYSDYTAFATEAAESKERFIANPPVELYQKINKQILFGSSNPQ